MSETSHAVLVELRIRNLLAECHRALDEADLQRIVDCYHAEAVVHVVDDRPLVDRRIQSVQGRPAIEHFYASVIEQDAGQRLRHLALNTVVECVDDNWRSVTYNATVRLSVSGATFEAFGWSDDHYEVANDGRVCFVERTLHLEAAAPTIVGDRYSQA